MPRRRRRFAQLEKQLRESGGQPAPGSRLANYKEFKEGKRTIEVQNKIPVADRKRYGFGILPFGVTPADTNPKRYAAGITKYSYDQRTEVGLSNAKLGYENINAGTEQSENFYPALLRVFTSTASITNPISGVTGKKYSRRVGKTYSFPFGRTLTDKSDKETAAAETSLKEVDEEDAKKSLIINVRAVEKVKSVSYEPEVFRIGKQDLVSPSS